MRITETITDVWHRGLIIQMKNFKIPLAYITLISNYLNDWKYHIKSNESFSQGREMKAEIPQRSVYLYLIYSADFPKDDWANTDNTQKKMYYQFKNEVKNAE